jgi:hydrogenase maturation protease
MDSAGREDFVRGREAFLMRTLLIACGNVLRRDDGIAHAVTRLLRPATDLAIRTVHQLSPELAEEIADFSQVIFVDADRAATYPRIALVSDGAGFPALTHASGPAAIVAFARAVYGFSGEAWMCRIPAPDLSHGEGLSPAAENFARKAAQRMERFLSRKEGRA